MSYCRWSCDDYQCDLYCYEDCSGGFTTHVRGTRPVFKTPLPEVVPLDNEHVDEWLIRHEEVNQMVSDADFVNIGLPFDGETFCDNTLQDLLDRLIMLKEVGYRFPDYVIEEVKMEMEGQG